MCVIENAAIWNIAKNKKIKLSIMWIFTLREFSLKSMIPERSRNTNRLCDLQGCVSCIAPENGWMGLQSIPRWIGKGPAGWDHWVRSACARPRRLGSGSPRGPHICRTQGPIFPPYGFWMAMKTCHVVICYLENIQFPYSFCNHDYT